MSDAYVTACKLLTLGLVGCRIVQLADVMSGHTRRMANCFVRVGIGLRAVFYDSPVS